MHAESCRLVKGRGRSRLNSPWSSGLKNLSLCRLHRIQSVIME